MADFTQVNLADVADVGGGGATDSRFPGPDLGAVDTGFAVHSIKPGQRGAVHRHDEAEEVYFVLEGSGRASLDGTLIDIGTDDAIRVAPQVVRSFEAGDDGLRIIAFGPRFKGDGELLDESAAWGQAD